MKYLLVILIFVVGSWLYTFQSSLDALIRRASSSETQITILQHTQEWGSLGHNHSCIGAVLGTRLKRFAYGFGTHAASSTSIEIPPGATRFSGECGINMMACNSAAVVCKVFRDSELVFTSKDLNFSNTSAQFVIPLGENKKIVLITRSAKNNNDCNHVDWGNLEFE